MNDKQTIPLTYNMRPCWHPDIQHFTYLAAFVPVDKFGAVKILNASTAHSCFSLGTTASR